jgi:hypothetical protein
MKTKISKIATIIAIGVSIISCSPEDGKDGAPGLAGTNGIDGTNSNVNVISRPWRNVLFTGSGTNWDATIAELLLIQSVLDTGLVLIYSKNSTGDIFMTSNTVTPYFWTYINVGVIAIESSTNKSGQYRVIIIPRASSSLERRSQSDYSKMSYQEVCKKFNIPE